MSQHHGTALLYITLRNVIQPSQQLNGIYKSTEEYFVPLPSDDTVLARLEDVRDSIVRGAAILDREIERLFCRAEELEGMLQESAIAISGMEKEFRGEWESRTLDKLAEKLRQEDAAALAKERGPTSDPLISSEFRRRKPIPKRQMRANIKAIPDISFVRASGSSEVPIQQSSHDLGDTVSGLDIGSLSMDDFEQAVKDVMAG